MTAARAWVCVITLCGCDKLLGLDTLPPNPPGDGGGPSDARDGDAIFDDAPASCEGTLMFGAPVAMFPATEDYVIGGQGGATEAATTYFMAGSPQPEIASTATNIFTSLALSPKNGGVVITPRLSPNTFEIFARELDDEGTETFDWYSSPDGSSWNAGGSLQIMEGTSSASAYVSQPTAAGGPRYMLYSDPLNANTFDELEERSLGLWSPQVTHMLTEIGTTEIYQPNLSSDGRRMVFVAQGAIYLASRADVLKPFVDTQMLVPSTGTGLATPYLSDDCTKLFYSSMNSGTYSVEVSGKQ